MITVKHASLHPDMKNILPQSGVWGNCRFDLSPDCRKYDWFVVFNDLPREERLVCPRENTILLLTEPATYKAYPDNYLRQFGVVVDMQTRGVNRHPNIKRFSTIWSWGERSFAPNGRAVTYEEMLNMPPPQKSKWLSVVCSKRWGTDFHYRRLKFCARVVKDNPEVDFYGAGIRPIEDKADALLPYRFHLAVENLRAEDHWTEKLAEPYLAYCVSAYCGCPNVGDLFPPESVVPVDIDDYAAAAELIRALDESEYRRRFDAVCEARHLLLTKHHPANKIAEWVNEGAPAAAENGGVIRTIKDCAHHSGLGARLAYHIKRQRHKERRTPLRNIRRKLIIKELRKLISLPPGKGRGRGVNSH